jgi:SAM-dependent methyltransferase
MTSLADITASPYDGLAQRYERSRPSYPPDSISHLRADAGDLVADIGAGTGIFTRQLALLLDKARVVGIEASADMLRQAEQSSAGIANLSFLRGTAEALPFEDDAVRLLTVATAIHWFDRDAFYAEASRCLRADGELVVIQNIRRWWEDPFLAGYEALHEAAVAGYRRGRYPARHGGYDELDVARELATLPDFGNVRVSDFHWSRSMTHEEFVDFSHSSSITQRAVQAMGQQPYLQALRRLLDQHARTQGVVDVAYLTRVTSAVPLPPDAQS